MFKLGAMCVLAVCLFASERGVVETVIPALAYGGGCSSSIELINLGQAGIAVDVEAHREDGALAPVSGTTTHLAPGQTLRVEAQIEEESNSAWVEVREHVAPGSRPVVSVRGTTVCVEAKSVKTLYREVAYPMRNPWFDGDVADLGGGSILLINTSAQAGRASVCYSAGSEFSLPGGKLKPVCSYSAEVQVPPFGSRIFPVRQGASTHFGLRTSGSRIVLQMLRSVAGSTRMFAVDSSIAFGEP